MVVAHADDEVVACGGLLQLARAAQVVMLTDSAPLSAFFWKEYGSREEYARVRALEAKEVAMSLGKEAPLILDIPDQQLFRNLPQAWHQLERIALRFDPAAIVTLAYEGGHPDHDCCAFLAHELGHQIDVPVWEAPLYHRASGEETSYQQFIGGDSGASVPPAADVLAKKYELVSLYPSQAKTLEAFDPALERLRPQSDYDFSTPPHEGQLNYEAWGWPMTGPQLCQEFIHMQEQLHPEMRLRTA